MSIGKKLLLLSFLMLAFLSLHSGMVLAGTENTRLNEVSFSVTDSTAYIYHTTDDNNGLETATLFFKVAFDQAQSGYLQGATIKLEYDSNLVFLGDVRPSVGWGSVNPTPIIVPGNPTTVTYIIDPVPGESSIGISQTATTLAEFDFHIKCQAVPQTAQINIAYSGAGTTVDDGTDIFYIDDPLRSDHGSVGVWNYSYTSWLADGDLIQEYEGALGTVIDVPLFINSDFRVASADMTFSYDDTLLEFVGLADWDWYFTDAQTTLPSSGLMNVVLATDESIIPRHQFFPTTVVMNLQFRVLGSWHGGSTLIDFPNNPSFEIALDAGTCETSIGSQNPFGGTVDIPQYQASYSTELLDGYFSLYDDTAEVKISLTNNFPAGLAQDEIISNLNMGTDLEAKWINSETVDFGMFTFGGGPIDPQEVSLRRYTGAGFMDISSSAQPMVGFRVDKSTNFTVPTTYDDRFTYFTYQTPFDATSFDAIVVDTTGLVNLSEGAGLSWDTPDPIEFLMGEYFCPSVQSGNNDLTQTYYTRSSFSLHDFKVKITVSGPHHMYDITPVAGVEVESFDNVSYKWAILRSIPGVWTDQAPTATRTQFASIIYTRNGGSNMAAKAGPGGGRGYWVTKTSTVSFDFDNPNYYMEESGTGLLHHVVAVGGNVVSKWWVDAFPNQMKFGSQLPDNYELLQNYPNPFNPSTEIDFGLPTASQVELKVYNIAGQMVETLVSETMEAGWHSVTWDGVGFASGIYLYRLQAGNFFKTEKMILLK